MLQCDIARSCERLHSERKQLFGAREQAMTPQNPQGAVIQENQSLVLPGLTLLLREAASAAQLFVAEAKPAVKTAIAGPTARSTASWPTITSIRCTATAGTPPMPS
jgi:hypothetical protein